MSLIFLLVQFALCALAIALGGLALSRSADRLAGLYGWGRGWVGLALLATVTSLPELSAGVSAVALYDAPSLAVGNALGACVVNLGFLVVVDLLHREVPMYRLASDSHLLSAGFGVVMLGLTAMSLLAGPHAPALLHVGVYTPALLGLYLLALRSVFAHERAREGRPAQSPSWQRPSAATLRRHWGRFGAAAVVVLAAGIWLPGVAAGLAQALGLSHSFVATVFMALVTTLPEMAVTLGALRLGALDMAIGNLLGSNLFNLAILGLDDLAYARAPLLAAAGGEHAVSVAAAVVMSGLVIVGLVMRPQGRVLRIVGWISIGLLAAYVIHAAVLLLRAG